MNTSLHPSASPVVAGNPSLRKCCVPKCHNSVRPPERKCRSCKAASRRSNRSHSFTKPTAAAVLARSSTAPTASPLTVNTDFYRDRAERADELAGLRANIARLRVEQAAWFQEHGAGETWPGYELLFDLEDALANFEIAQSAQRLEEAQ